MKNRLTIVFLAFILLGSFLFGSGFIPKIQAKAPDVFVGIDVAYEDMNQIKNLVNEISSYTNFFVVGCSAITRDKTKLEEICQYLYGRGFYFMIYQEWPLDYNLLIPSTSSWFGDAKEPMGRALPRNLLSR